uniref:Nitroreductase family protein n=1 Tax=Anaerolinea thermolimosa TaxID=229919 RepID=A0A7C4KI62_9CHLR
MSVKDLVLKSRSYRRFDENHAISREQLLEWVDLARVCPNGANMQPLKYAISCDRATNARIFPHLRWAGALKDWGGPKEGERPSAYIVILCDKTIRETPGCDHGIAAQSILLAATEAGLGGCMIGALDRMSLSAELRLPKHLDIALVVALGKPAEKVVLEGVRPDGTVTYYRDAQSVHHVPKRALGDILVVI